MLRRPVAAAALALLAAACADPAGTNLPGGTLVVAMAGEPNTLVPALAATASDQAIAQQLFDRLADLPDDLNTLGDRGFRPRLAQRWDWSADSLQIRFHLDPRARWHDGRPVRAEDVRFTWALYADPKTGAPFAPLITNIDSVTVADSLTAVFWFHRRTAEQFYDATYQMLIHPAHRLAGVAHDSLRTSPFAQAPVGSGRFRFVAYQPGVQAEIAADTGNYKGRAKLDRVIFKMIGDPSAALAQLLAREVDVVDNLRPEAAAQVTARSDLRVEPYRSLLVGYVALSLHDKATPRPHPVLGDVAMRRALALSLDRTAYVRAVFDSNATVPDGPAPSAIAPRDTALHPWPHDPAAADRLLDSLGWARGADGMRARNGQPLALRILVPSTSATRQRLATFIQAALKERGIALTVESLEPTALVPRRDARDFDLFIQAVSLDPTLSVLKQSWGGANAMVPRSSNITGYASPAFDALSDSAIASGSPAAARTFWARAFRVINDDVPGIWLYEPRTLMGIHRRIEATRLLPTYWFAGLADWSIPASQRLPRDRTTR